jgi:hypothetical protein
MPLGERQIVIFEECTHGFHERCLGDNEKKCPDGICRLRGVSVMMGNEVSGNPLPQSFTPNVVVVAPELLQFGEIVTQPNYAAGKAFGSRNK